MASCTDAHVEKEPPCAVKIPANIKLLKDPRGKAIVIDKHFIGIRQKSQIASSLRDSTSDDSIDGKFNHKEFQMISFIPSPDDMNPEFSFTQYKVMFDATRILPTSYGRLRCMPNAEFKLWSAAGLCDTSPLIITLDDVIWRVIASEKADVTNTDAPIVDDLDPVLECYLRAHKEGGKLLQEVKTATERGEKDLNDHREYLFKIFSLLSIPPTLSHDLSKTNLVNFCLGRCFHGEDLEILKEALSFDQCMGLAKRLHLEVENHHPEHGSRHALSVLDMYLDRVSRGVQKSHGWNNAAWHIPERYAPPEYKDDFKEFEKKYNCYKLEDPGEIDIPDPFLGQS